MAARSECLLRKRLQGPSGGMITRRNTAIQSIAVLKQKPAQRTRWRCARGVKCNAVLGLGSGVRPDVRPYTVRRGDSVDSIVRKRGAPTRHLSSCAASCIYDCPSVPRYYFRTCICDAFLTPLCALSSTGGRTTITHHISTWNGTHAHRQVSISTRLRS